MVFSALSVFSVVAFGLCAAEKLHLPVPTCKHDSNNYNSCLKDAITEAWPLFVKGLPEFEFPPLDPYFFSYQKMVLNSSSIQGVVIASNITVLGMKNTRFITVKPHFSNDDFRLDIKSRVPEHFYEGDVEAEGSVLGFRTGGKGYFNVTIEDIRITWHISGSIKDDTWIVEHFLITAIPKKIKIYLTNFFEGNQEMNELATSFANEYWPQLYRVVSPVVTDYLDKFYSDLLTRFFAKLSFSEIFP